MRTLIILLAILPSVCAFGQSKKALAAQVATLKAENDKLKSDIETLKKPKVPELKDTVQKVSYAIGTMMASSLKNEGGDSLKIDAIAQGFKDVYAEDSLRIPQEEGTSIVQAYMQGIMTKKIARVKGENEQFLENNKTQPGVITTSTGLQYKVINSGKGKSPKATDNVTVHYTGKLIDGSVFDSSVARNEPASFKLDGIIPGWTEALQLMREGDKWTIFIPSILGYGEQGINPQIPPHATLIFDVELIKVN